jgi:hypothetical protein
MKNESLRLATKTLSMQQQLGRTLFVQVSEEFLN